MLEPKHLLHQFTPDLASMSAFLNYVLTKPGYQAWGRLRFVNFPNVPGRSRASCALFSLAFPTLVSARPWHAFHSSIQALRACFRYLFLDPIDLPSSTLVSSPCLTVSVVGLA
jgi:hypothetical protein